MDTSVIPPPMEADKGGALLYIDEHYNTKQLPNIDKIMYKSKKSVFIEICSKNKKNIIVGCIYRHPSMVNLTKNFLILQWKKLVLQTRNYF